MINQLKSIKDFILFGLVIKVLKYKNTYQLILQYVEATNKILLPTLIEDVESPNINLRSNKDCNGLFLLNPCLGEKWRYVNLKK